MRPSSWEPTNSAFAADLAAAVEVSDLALRLIRSAVRPEIVTVKNLNDYATETDELVERAVTARLSELSDHPVQGEEFSATEGARTRWVIDPIDGTFNFFNGVPLAAFSVALVIDGEPVVGAVTSLSSDERLVAVQGEGAYQGGCRIRIVPRPLDESAVMVGDFTTTPAPAWPNEVRTRVIGALGNSAGRVRMIGTAATDLAWVATGRAAASVTFSNNAWDVCAGVLLVREAGGEVLDLDGQRWNLASDSVVAGASSTLARRVCDLVAVGNA